jgi:hypothetical protein
MLQKFEFVVVTAFKENEAGGTCGKHGRGGECVQGFGGKARRKEPSWKTKAWMRGGVRMNLRDVRPDDGGSTHL